MYSFESYDDYIIKVLAMMEGNSDSYHKCVSEKLVIKRKFNSTGETYRFLTEDEYDTAFKTPALFENPRHHPKCRGYVTQDVGWAASTLVNTIQI